MKDGLLIDRMYSDWMCNEILVENWYNNKIYCSYSYIATRQIRHKLCDVLSEGKEERQS